MVVTRVHKALHIYACSLYTFITMKLRYIHCNAVLTYVLQALSKALMELRADMVQQAEEEVKAAAGQATAEQNVQRVVDKHTKKLVEQVEELTSKNDKLRAQLKKHKDKSESVNVEVEELRHENGLLQSSCISLIEFTLLRHILLIVRYCHIFLEMVVLKKGGL